MVLDLLFHLCCLFYWVHEFREATKCELVGVEDVWQYSVERALAALSQVRARGRRRRRRRRELRARARGECGGGAR
eukprot:scaffold3069_cov227-Prasinococcus_capsulatus_cf.AAC.1